MTAAVSGPGRRQLVTLQYVADYFGVTPRTVRTYVSEGRFPVYRLPGSTVLRFDMRDIDASLTVIPTVRARGTR